MLKGLSDLGRLAGRWLRSRAGNLTLTTALMAPTLALVVMLGVEVSSLAAEREQMQRAADTAALAVARDQTVAGRSGHDVQGFVRQVALAQLGDYTRRATVTFTAQSEVGGRIRVDGVATRQSFFGNRLPSGGFRVQVRSIAEASSQVPICVVTLAPTGSNRFQMTTSARISATGCLVHSNRDIDLLDTAHLQADVIQAAGAANGAGFGVTPNTGALRLRNPFSNLPMPSTTSCATTVGTHTFSSGVNTLPAGLHCDHIIVQGSARLQLGPGDHVFRGRLRVRQTATLTGEDVALIFMHPGSNVEFINTATVELSGRRSGVYAGFVMLVGHGLARGIQIASPNVNRILGTVYTSHGWVQVTSSGEVAEDSDWSVIVANRLLLSGSPNLVINTRYAGSPVPVPGGVGDNMPGDLRLVE
jgi:Flp pilus assembly protein TadG